MDLHAAIDDARFLRFHKKLVAACLGGPILDGYILSIIAIALMGVSADFGTSPLEQASSVPPRCWASSWGPCFSGRSPTG